MRRRTPATITFVLSFVFFSCACTQEGGQPARHEEEQPPVEQRLDKTWVWVEEGLVAASPAPERTPGGADAWLQSLLDEALHPLAILNLRASPDPDFGDAVAATAHVHITDYQPPTPEQAADAVAFIQQQRAAGRTVVVHCAGGCGRTGTILALYLMAAHQFDGAEALERLREIRACFVETTGQEEFVLSYAPGR